MIFEAVIMIIEHESMGVPKFVGWLSRNPKFKQAIKSSLDEVMAPTGARKPWPPARDIDVTALDLNGFVYKAWGELSKLLGKNPDMEEHKNPALLELNILERVWVDIIRVMDHTKPQFAAVIAVDGVAPLAKILQQRGRRFNKAKEIEGAIKLGQKTLFNTTKISPGTDFMFRMDEFLQNKLRTSAGVGNMPAIVLYSSHLNPGEGEHIIAEQIKLLPEKDVKDRTLLIHGADADLVMIYLNHLKYGWDDIILMRETVLRSGKANNTYISLWKLSKSIRSMYNTENPEGDFVSLLFLNGNDFLPHFLSLNRVPDALETLIVGYKEYITLRKAEDSKFRGLTTNDELDMTEYSGFIQYIAQYVPHLIMLWALNEPVWVNPRYSPKYTEEESPMQVWLRGHIRDHLEIPAEFADRAYEYALTTTHPNYPEPHKFAGHLTQQDRTNMLASYVEGIVWVWNYYSKGRNFVSKRWSYPYHHAPLFDDLAGYINDNLDTKPWTSVLDTKSKNISPLLQLPMIIPRGSIEEIPKQLHPLYHVDSPISHLMPTDFRVDAGGKMNIWQGVPILPIPNIKMVTAAVKSLGLNRNFKHKFNEVDIIVFRPPVKK
jgi:5'-3' exonuclease